LTLLPQYISSIGPIQYGFIGVPFCILILSLPAVWDEKKQKLIAIALLLLIPLGINLVVSLTIQNIFVPRALIPALLPLALFWAMPILMKQEGLLSRYKKLALLAMGLCFWFQ